MAIHTISCPEEIEKLVKELNISPSEAFRIGVLKLANQEPTSDYTQTEEGITNKNLIMKLQRANRVIQEELLKATDKIEAMGGYKQDVVFSKLGKGKEE